MENPQVIKVSCFGAGFVGLPTISVLACHNRDAKFVIYDIDKDKINKCKNREMPIYEPGLEETVKRAGDNLHFTDKIDDALQNVDVIFLALPTPTKLFGEEKGKAYDLSYTETAIRQIIQFYNRNSDKIKSHVIMVQKSTVPIGTARMITDLIKTNSIQQNRDKFAIVSNPEFLAEGTAIKDFQFPDRVVIGSKEGVDIKKLKNLYNFVDQSKIITTNQFSAQLSKLVNNCFLAQRVSSINSIAILCQQTQADVKQIKKCIASDSRIGDKFLNSSIGFGGSCFKKDMLALIYIAESKGLKQVANYWNAVLEMNNFRKQSFFRNVFKLMNHNLKFKKLAIFGIAFKKDTNDARESPAIQICQLLLQEGAILNIHDPKTPMQALIQQMKYHNLWKQEYEKRLFQYHTAQETVKEAHAILVLTEWDQFKTLKYDEFYPIMQKPSYIFDGRNILNDKEMLEIGFRYHRCGKNYSSIENGFAF